MIGRGLHRPGSRLIASALAASFAAFVLFSLNILIGKFAAFFGWDPELRLARVPEFGLLFGAAVFFVVAALAAERQAGGGASTSQSTNGENHHEEEPAGH
jgi:hypothetical protein